jgi:3-deoxy-D-manno-octulosonic acid kinase
MVKTWHEGQTFCLIHPQFADHWQLAWFSPDFWQQQQAIEGQALGRGVTYFIHYQQQHWVLRHYYRGGLIGRILHDSYLFTGYHNTRAVAEFNLLHYLHQQQLPVPEPIACKISRQGLRYQADIMTKRIENAQDMVSLLQQAPLNREHYYAIGQTIAQFHLAGVYHHDLNCHNILIDHQQRIWLIDFDQGKLRPPHPQWQLNNLNRLKRSLLKEQKKLASFHWHLHDWQYLYEGYQSVNQLIEL